MTDDRFDEELRAGLHGLVDDAEPAPGLRERAERGSGGRPRLLQWGSLAAAAMVLALIGVVTLSHEGSSARRVATRPGPATSTSAESNPVAGPAEETSTTTTTAGRSSTTTTAHKRAATPPTTAKSPPTTPPTTLPPGPPRGTLAFVKGDGSGAGSAIYFMNADGSNQHQVGPNGSAAPAWSRDGTKIAYTTTQNGIYVMNADGGGQHQVTSGQDSEPSWSPDGTTLVFTRYAGDYPNTDIYRVSTDGTGLKQLTANRATNHFPHWSPDGTVIAFGQGSGAGGIYFMDPDGGNVRLVVAGWMGSLSWSPDGQRIAFTPSTSGISDVWVVNRDGTGRTQITDDRMHDFDPSWSPDGWIAYAGAPDGGRWTLFLVRPDGSGHTSLVMDQMTNPDPAWRGAF